MIKYKISGNIVKYKSADYIDIHSWQEEFQNFNPIIARTEAIKRYKDILDEIKEAGYAIEDKITRGGDPFDDMDLGIGVYCEIIDPYDKAWDGIDIDVRDGLGETAIEASKWVWTEGGFNEDDFCLNFEDYSWKIIGVGGFGSSPQWFVDSLEKEITIYDFLNYDKNGLETKAPCFNHNTRKINEHRILEIPFNWNVCYKELESYVDEKINRPEKTEPEPELVKYLGIIKKGEGKQVEFKSTLNYCINTKEKKDYIKLAIAKTIAAFLNTKGGLLFIGVNNNCEVDGLENDFQGFEGKNKKDSFSSALNNIIRDFLSNACHQHIDAKFYTHNNLDFMVVTVAKSAVPVTLKNKNEKEFYIRGIANTEKLDIEDTIKWVLEKFKEEK